MMSVANFITIISLLAPYYRTGTHISIIREGDLTEWSTLGSCENRSPPPVRLEMLTATGTLYS
jgi:hypothetical protein